MIPICVLFNGLYLKYMSTGDDVTSLVAKLYPNWTDDTSIVKPMLIDSQNIAKEAKRYTYIYI